METVRHLPTDRLEAGLDHVAASPDDHGAIAMVVARPADRERRVLERGTFTTHDGLVGDNWRQRYAGTPNVEGQLTVMNARFLDLVADGDRSRWPLAGDQVVVDLDLGTDNLAPGDRLRLGTALVEVTPKPHRGCAKFVDRFGVDAQRLVASDTGMDRRLRGIYVRVLEEGEATPGDTVAQVPTT